MKPPLRIAVLCWLVFAALLGAADDGWYFRAVRAMGQTEPPIPVQPPAPLPPTPKPTPPVVPTPPGPVTTPAIVDPVIAVDAPGTLMVAHLLEFSWAHSTNVQKFHVECEPAADLRAHIAEQSFDLVATSAGKYTLRISASSESGGLANKTLDLNIVAAPDTSGDPQPDSKSEMTTGGISVRSAVLEGLKAVHSPSFKRDCLGLAGVFEAANGYAAVGSVQTAGGLCRNVVFLAKKKLGTAGFAPWEPFFHDLGETLGIEENGSLPQAENQFEQTAAILLEKSK